MELPDVVDQILDHLANVDFSKTDTSVSLFETTIRYLAGMLSGYDLLNDDALSHLASNVNKIASVVVQFSSANAFCIARPSRCSLDPVPSSRGCHEIRFQHHLRGPEQQY